MIWYVYTLSTPFPEAKPFYVGKGSGNRISAHCIQARTGVRSRKCTAIRQVWAGGGEVLQEKIAFFSDEAEAYLFEQRLISFIGRENLTNSTDGGGYIPDTIGRLQERKLCTFGEYLAVACTKHVQRRGLKRFSWRQLSVESGVSFSIISKSVVGIIKPSVQHVWKLIEVLEPNPELAQMLCYSLRYSTRQEAEEAEALIDAMEQAEGIA